jgi:hypothetical protein
MLYCFYVARLFGSRVDPWVPVRLLGRYRWNRNDTLGAINDENHQPCIGRLERSLQYGVSVACSYHTVCLRLEYANRVLPTD